MKQLGIVDKRRNDRINVHALIVGGLLVANFIALVLTENVRSNDQTWFFAVVLILLVGTLAAGYGINWAEDQCQKPKPMHCPQCRSVLPISTEWRCGYCSAVNTGSPLKPCTICGCSSKAILCPKAECGHAVLLRAPLGDDPIAIYDRDEQDVDTYDQRLEDHRKQQKVFELEKKLAEAEAESLKAQEQVALAKKDLARVSETPEQTYEREVLGLLQSEGKRREVMKRLRDEIEQEQDIDERLWKAGVLDRIERESLEL